jgi:hypothetical protein
VRIGRTAAVIALNLRAGYDGTAPAGPASEQRRPSHDRGRALADRQVRDRKIQARIARDFYRPASVNNL